jgi:hypothetical protein
MFNKRRNQTQTSVATAETQMSATVANTAVETLAKAIPPASVMSNATPPVGSVSGASIQPVRESPISGRLFDSREEKRKPQGS